MSPGWKYCMYCDTADDPILKRLASGQQPDTLNPKQAEKGSDGSGAVQPVQPTKTSSGVAAEPGRRIVGFLITYTWDPMGQIFPIREGRNLVGRDATRCDIAIPQDGTLSGVNFHITFRGNFVIGDSVSLSGTDLNGVPIKEQFVPLPNYASIRSGSTFWKFVMVEPA